MRLIILAIFILAAVAPASASRRAKLRNPTFVLKDSHSVAEVKKAVRAALSQKKWAVFKTTDTSFEAVYRARKHRVDVLIEFSKDRVKVSYISSKNLLYKKKKDGTEFIHERYFIWLQNLHKEIKRNLGEQP